MNRTKRRLLVLVFLLFLLAIPTVAVFAKELGYLTVSGPGIKGEMTLDHHDFMMKLEQTGFFEQNLSIKPPETLGDGYHITAYLNLDGKVVPFAQMVYYATDGKTAGYVHYTARLTGESLQPVDQWQQLNINADSAFRGLMDEYKIALQPAFTVAAAASAAKPAKDLEAPVKEPAVNQPALKEPVAEPVVVKSEASKAEAAAPAQPSAVSAAPNQLVIALAASLFLLLGAGLMIRRRTAGQRSSQA